LKSGSLLDSSKGPGRNGHFVRTILRGMWRRTIIAFGHCSLRSFPNYDVGTLFEILFIERRIAKIANGVFFGKKLEEILPG